MSGGNERSEPRANEIRVRRGSFQLLWRLRGSASLDVRRKIGQTLSRLRQGHPNEDVVVNVATLGEVLRGLQVAEHDIDKYLGELDPECRQKLNRALRLPDRAPAASVLPEREGLEVNPRGKELLPQVRRVFGPAVRVVRRLTRDVLEGEVKVVTIHSALGGAGKSATVGHFLERLRKHGARRPGSPVKCFVYGFNDRRRHGHPSTEAFFRQALEWLGTTPMPHWSADSLADRLGELLCERPPDDRRIILVLDGIEGLQRAVLPQSGEFLESAGSLAILLRRIADPVAGIAGLCVLTSRLQVLELADAPASRRYRLDPLDVDEGLRFVYSLGATLNRPISEADEAALARVLPRFGGHLLTLRLVSGFLRERGRERTIPAVLAEIVGADSRRHVERTLDEVTSGPDETDRYAPEKMDLARFDGILRCYIERHAGEVERDLLELLSLFGRAATGNNLACLMQLDRGQFEAQLGEPIRRLERHGLLHCEPRGAPVSIEGLPDHKAFDLHPWVRESMAAGLSRRDAGVTFANLQRRLSRHFLAAAALATEEAEAEYLRSAVKHACLAGDTRSAFWDIYWPLLCRVDPQTGAGQFASLRRFGGFDRELEALAFFFERPWNQFHGSLDEHTRGLVLGVTGFCLRASGKLERACDVLTDSSQMLTQCGRDPLHLCRVAGVLGETLRSQGGLRRADCVARQAVQLAETLGADSLRIDALTRLADVLHFQNRLSDAEDCFDAARRFGNGVLTGIASVRWCEFLITKQRFAEVGQQCETALQEPGSALDGLPHALHTLYSGISRVRLAADEREAREAVDGLVARGIDMLKATSDSGAPGHGILLPRPVAIHSPRRGIAGGPTPCLADQLPLRPAPHAG